MHRDRVKRGGRMRIETEAAEVERDADGVVHLRFRPDTVLVGENTGEVGRAHIEAAAGKPRPCLADVREVKSTSHEARDVAVSPEVAAIIDSLAVIVDSPLSRVLGNFFIRLRRPEYPTRLVPSEEEGLAWLESVRTDRSTE